MKDIKQYIYENNKPVDNWKSIDFETAIKELKNNNRVYISNIKAFFKLISNNKLHVVYDKVIDSEKAGLKSMKDTMSLSDFKKYYGPNNEHNIEYKFKIPN